MSRNIISYNEPDKQKTSRASKRKDSNSDDDDFGINNSITVKASAVSRIQVGNVSSKYILEKLNTTITIYISKAWMLYPQLL